MSVNRIKDEIRNQGRTFRHVAAECDMDPSYLHRIANGNIEPKVRKALRIARVLGVAVEEVFLLDEAA